MRQIVEFAVLFGVLYGATIGLGLLDLGFVARIVVIAPLIALVLLGMKRFRKP